MDGNAAFGKSAAPRAPRRSEEREESRVKKTIRPDPERGLSEKEAERSRELYGENVLTKKKARSFAAEFFHNLSDPIIRILLCAMGINAALTFRNINWAEIGGIGATVFIATLVSTVSEYSSSKAFEKLRGGAEGALHTVVRDGAPVPVESGKIVRGDLLVLSAGQIVPCDCVAVKGAAEVDQSSLTGESAKIRKAADPALTARIAAGEFPAGGASDPYYICAGSNVISGECSVIAVAVGDDTAYGRIAAELQGDENPSPLKERLRRLAVSISRIGYVASAVVAAAYLFNSFVIGSGFDTSEIVRRATDVRFVLTEVLHALTVAVSIVVVAVPEGLPMMITVVLSANMKKMMKNGVVVKKLVGIETAGNLSLLFTDKTGTLTTGNMTVESVVTADGEYSSAAELKKAARIYRLSAAAAAFCSAPGGSNATAAATEAFFGSSRPAGMRALSRVPFDSERKYAAALTEDTSAGEKVVIIRGAPERILPRCAAALAADGTAVPIGRGAAERIREGAGAGRDGKTRVIAQATAPESAMAALEEGRVPERLTFNCLFMIRDEVRAEARPAAELCSTAGVRVVMITGDGKETAEAVARSVGILGNRFEEELPEKGSEGKTPLVLSSEQIAERSDEELARLLPRIAVLYRVTPADKSRLVRVAQEAGHVVGMTGDGVNDSPALKAADVGFAMGSGAEVAKEAGDIVISDDNFESITRAILYGRTIFESIRKFITFQLIMNFCAVGVSIIGPLIGVETPITIPQMLWVNIIMDTLGSLAFAGEAPLKSYMKRAPRKREEPILSSDTVKKIVALGTFSLSFFAVFMASGAIRARFGGGTYYLTVFFSLFVFFGIANAVCARCERINVLAGMMKNAPFVLIMGAVAAIQLLLIRFGGELFRTVPISRGDLLLTAALSASVFPADFITKTVILRKRRKRKTK